jgi:uncharacterized protein YdeI (BOF family)
MTSKIVGLFSGGILLLGLAMMPLVGDVAFAEDHNKGAQGKDAQGLPCDVPHGQNVTQAEQDAKQGSHVIFGEVTRVDGMTYVVKDESGKEVKLQTDERTEKSPINQGDHISASVDKQNHALWIRANRGTDRRTEHVAGGCDPS